MTVRPSFWLAGIHFLAELDLNWLWVSILVHEMTTTPNTTVETPLNSGIMDSPLRRSTESETGYSTDYSTFEISRHRSRTSSVSRSTLPDRSLLDSTFRRGRSTEDRVECQELLGASTDAGIAANSRLATLDGDDVCNRKEEEEEEEEEEDIMRDDPQCCSTSTINCSLIPSCVIRKWKVCKICYIIWMGMLLVAVAFTAGVGIFWGVEIFKYRSRISKTVDLATSGAYNVTSEFHVSNIFSNNLCLSFKRAIPTFDITDLSTVNLFSESCSDVLMTIRNESLYRDSALQYNSYMFHWLHGSTVRIHAHANGNSLVTVYLLNDTESENYCSMHLQPEKIVMKWRSDIDDHCYLVHPEGYLDCYFDTTIDSSGTYFVCINSTIFNGFSYEINISSVVYNTSSTKMRLSCTQEEECCLPFDDLAAEILHPTCMYISTQPLSSDFLGMKLVNVNIEVGQRLSMIQNCFILIVGLLFILGVTVIFFLLTRYKANNPNFDPRGCSVHCSMYRKH